MHLINVQYISLFLLWLCVCVSHFSCFRLFATPWTVSRQAPLSMEYSRQEYWSGLPFPSTGSSQPRDQTWVSHIAGSFFTVGDTREAQEVAGIGKNTTPKGLSIRGFPGGSAGKESACNEEDNKNH